MLWVIGKKKGGGKEKEKDHRQGSVTYIHKISDGKNEYLNQKNYIS